MTQPRLRELELVREQQFRAHRAVIRNDLVEFVKEIEPDIELASFHLLIIEKLMAVERGEITRLLLAMPPGHGKLVADSAPVMTLDGWKRHGDLRVGDRVFSPDGQPVSVTGVSSPDLATYEMVFTDGSVVKVHGAHEWTVYDRAGWPVPAWRTVETQYLASQKVFSGDRARFQLPYRSALEFPEVDLPVEPYVLGAWLGDGTASKPCLTHAPDEVAVVRAVNASGYATSAVMTHSGTGVLTTYFGGPVGPKHGRLGRGLVQAGVWKNKHIPDAYLCSSRTQRLELLAGLIDTDGHVDPTRPRIRFVNSNRKLIDGVVDLVRSLGWWAYVHEAQPVMSSSGIQGKQVVYTVGFSPTGDIPTRLSRKKVVKFAPAKRRIGIREVRRAAPEIGRCIKVDSDDGLYLVGTHLTPTHNSSHASIWFPAWYLGKNPAHSLIAASHTDKLAEKWSRRVRGLLMTKEYQKIFDTRISDKTQAVGEWETQDLGEYFACGIGAGISGRRSHLAIIDDPFKSHADADSLIVRDGVWEWYLNDLHHRQHPGGKIILILTRWNEDDLAGRLLDQMGQGGEHWEVLSLPAEAEADDILGRIEGEYLWPEYFTPEIYQTKKRMMTARDWSALFQQRPTPPGGLFFEERWFKWYDKAPENLVKYGASDYAVTQDGGDYTVHGVFGIDTEDNIYILDWWRKQTASDKWIEKLLDLMQKHKPMAWAEEKDQITKSLGPFINKRMRERRVNCLRKQYSSKGGDKSVKARSIQARISQGKLFLPKTAPWINDLVAEMLRFPAGKWDDQVDVLSLLGRMLDRLIRAPVPKPAPSDPFEVKALTFDELIAAQPKADSDGRRPRI